MAVNVSVFDLENFPSNPKTVTVDQVSVVPLGGSGDEVWASSFITTATASGGASIQRLYVTDTKFGWAKSSGLNTGPYNVTASQNHLKVAIDEDSSGAVEITLTADTVALSGDAVASDMQNSISALAGPGGAKDGNLSYLNAVVLYEDGQFKIISGTASSLYTGASRSSVYVADGTTTTGLAAELGLDIPFTSESLASNQVKQTSLASDYTSGTSLTVTTADLITGGDCIALTDGTNTEYRGVESAGGAGVTLASGFSNSYDAGSLVQVVVIQDSTGEPPPIYNKLDDYVRFGLASIVNQIDFSS